MRQLFVPTIGLSQRPPTLNRPFAASLVKQRSDDSFLEGIPACRMSGFSQSEPTTWPATVNAYFLDFPGFSGHLIGSLQLPVGSTYAHPIYAKAGPKDLRVHQEPAEVPQHKDNV
jgi:hypothetical protein